MGFTASAAPDEISPTYIRLPGYPAFLAAVFAVFGMEHYRAVLVLQMFVDVATCFLIADMARRLVSIRAARAAFLLAAVCPFLASYAAAALTETLEIFFTALALDFAIAGLETLQERRLRPWLGCGLAIGAAILLRPDGGLILAAIEFYLVFLWVRAFRDRTRENRQDAGESPAATRFSLIAGWFGGGVRRAGAAGSVGLAQCAHHAPFRASGAALRQRGR